MALSFKRTFWYHDPASNFPPEAVHHLEDSHAEAERLCLSADSREMTAYRRSKMIEEWCRVLPTLSELKYLWLPLKVSQALFDAACQVPNLEGLWVKWSSIRSLDPLPSREAFRFFHLGSSTSLESIDVLSSRSNLEWLELENLKKIRDFDALSSLKTLRALDLSGSMWATQYVTSLRPIGCLEDLRFLSLTNLRSDEKTLKPLYSLRRLEYLQLAKWWPEKELHELERRNPGLAA